MLQINTGKLFSLEIGHTNLLRGVLYSNFELPDNDPIHTNAGTLLPTDSLGRGNELIFEMQERIEATPSGPGFVISHGVSPYLDDFCTLMSFGLNGIASADAAVTQRLTNGTAGLSSYDPLNSFISRCFDKRITLNHEEIDDFILFVDELLALDRSSFLAAMRAIRTYVASVHRLSDDLALSYTLMVSAVESLVQKFDGYTSAWDDLDEKKTRKIDAILRQAPLKLADQIRDAIVEAEHGALSRRYRHFILSHIDKTYFRPPNAASGAISRNELEEALKQAYGIRSRYIHSSEALSDNLAHPFGHLEVTNIDRRPALTFQGLSRVTRHAIRRFVATGRTVEREQYDYSLERSGIMVAELASHLWIWKPVAKTAELRGRLEGFLSQLTDAMSGSKQPITDIRSVLSDVERLMPKAPKRDKPAMIALYALFNSIAPIDKKMPNFEKFLEKHQDIDEKSPETLVLRTYWNNFTDWTIETHRSSYGRYLENRSKPGGLHAPKLFDAAMGLALAERYRQAGDPKSALEIISFAVDNLPGHHPLIEFESQFCETAPIVWRDILFTKAN